MCFQGRIPGTDRWKPINEDPDAAEDWPGVLIVRLKESLDFGMHTYAISSVVALILTCLSPRAANTGRLKGKQKPSLILYRADIRADRLRRLELYGPRKSHPSEEPTREQTTVLVFHLADVEKVDASAVQIFYELLQEYQVRPSCVSIENSRLTAHGAQSRDVDLFMTHVRPAVRGAFERGGVVALLGEDRFFTNVAEAVAHIEMIELSRS